MAKKKTLKWRKDGDNWYATTHTLDFMIKKTFGMFFQLNKRQYLTWETTGCFCKMRSAKQVAHLIAHG